MPQQIDYGAFLEYQLRSLRAVDRKLLNMLRQAYISLDQEKNGYFTPAVSHKSVDDVYNYTEYMAGTGFERFPHTINFSQRELQGTSTD